MINNEANSCYYFGVKNFSELYSLGWLKSEKESIINGNNDFQNALNIVLNYQNIETHPARISRLKPYINKYNWEGIEFPAGSKDQKTFERNNKAIALKILLIKHNRKKIIVAYKYNHKRKKQVILLMITDYKKWHYLAVIDLSALFKEKLSNNNEDFYCLNCFNSYATKNKLKEHEEICNNNNSCCIEMGCIEVV